jgi:WD40 repeat protein
MRFSDPRTAMRLSVAAARLADTTETRSALIGAMAQRDEDVFAVPGADAGFDGSGNDVHRLTADGRSVVSVTAARIRIWDLRTRRLTLSAPGPGKLMDGVPAAVAPDGRTLALLMALSGHGRYLATGLNPYFRAEGTEPDRTRITVWDLKSRRAHATVVIGAAGGSLAVDGLALDTHGSTLLVYRSMERPSVEVWDVRREKRVKTVRSVRAADSVTAGSEGVRLALRPDGGALVTQEGLVADVRAGRMEPRVLGEDLISAAAYGPDGSLLAVGDVLGRVTLWDGAARARLGVLDGTTSDPTARSPRSPSPPTGGRSPSPERAADCSCGTWHPRRSWGRPCPPRATRSAPSPSPRTAHSSPPAPTSRYCGTTWTRGA